MSSSIPPITPAKRRGVLASLPPAIHNLDSYEPISRGLIEDAVWFVRNPNRRYLVRAVPPIEGAAFVVANAEAKGEPISWPVLGRWGKIVCYRTTPGGLGISRRAFACSRQEARNIERRYPDEASARAAYADPRLKHNDSFDGAGVLGGLQTVGGIQ